MKHWLGIFLHRAAQIAVYFLLVCVCLGGILWFGYQARYAGRIFPGITVNGVDVGGLSAGDALARLGSSATGGSMPYLALSAGERNWLMSPAALGASLLFEPAVAEALALGRSGVFRVDLATRLRLLSVGYHIQPAIKFDTSRMTIYIRELAADTVKPSRSALLRVEGLEITAEQERGGQEIDYTATHAAVRTALAESMGSSGWNTRPRLRLLGALNVQAGNTATEIVTVPIVFRDIAPRLSNYQQAVDEARLLLSRPITLEAPIEQIGIDGSSAVITQTWVVDQATLASWLVLKQEVTSEGQTAHVALDETKVLAYLQTLNTVISRPPLEGIYLFDPAAQTITVQKPAQIGYSLDVQAAMLLVQTLCFTEERTGILPLRSAQPTIRLADLQAMLPMSLISSGQTQFRFSSAERFQNIRRAAEEFQNVIVPPKATFSFLAELGAVTIANGYSESWIIYGNQTVLGPGGGVCQVATTLFQAAFYGGFPIIERTPHSYRITRYEPPAGLDAAVFTPSTDFKFTNDLDTPILILNTIDAVNETITFYIYGAPVNRTVRIEDAQTSNPRPAGDPVYEQDPTLAPGEMVLVESAHDGIDAVLTRVIEQNGQVISREQFFSRYRPWPARYLVGPPTQ